jgi:hypothetical protein
MVGVVVAFSILYPEAMRGLVIGGVVLIALSLVAFGAGGIWDIVYPRAMTWLADRDTLKARRYIRMQPDSHGFGGVVVDASTGAMRDLDTGEGFRLGEAAPPDPMRLEWVGRQKTVAALTGANIHQSMAPLVDDKGAMPQVEVAGLGNAGPWLQLDQPHSAEAEILDA